MADINIQVFTLYGDVHSQLPEGHAWNIDYSLRAADLHHVHTTIENILSMITGL